jgi:transposase
MRFYCGLDLSARTCQVCVVDEDLKVVVQEKVANELANITSLLEPYKEQGLEVVVESTFNWYWLVDGLQEAGYEVCLAHTLGLYMITGAKVKTDRRDALALAKLLRAGAIPKAYIYPKQTRPVRDLIRRRSRLVRLRAAELGSLRRLLYRQGIIEHSGNGIKLVIEEDIESWFRDPRIQISAKHELKRIWFYTTQIREMEKMIFHSVKGCEQYDRLLAIQGIGKTLAITIYYEVGDISRFPNARMFSSYCRVVPGVAQSGRSTRRGRGSKQGNPYLKWAFTQAAVHAVRVAPSVRRCYERHLRRHRGRGRKLIAYNIIAHKLAQAVYHVLRHDVDYKEEMLFGS